MSEFGLYVGLLRHFEDRPDVDGSRDTGIADITTEQVDGTALKIIDAAVSTHSKRVVLITSPLRRAVETNKEIARSVIEKAANLRVDTVTDERTASLTHGRYHKCCEPEIERSAWKAYVNETFTLANPVYRHGDPVHNADGVKYREIEGKFTQYGEHQWEFTRRLYSFLYGLQNLAARGGLDDTLVVLCSHTAIIMRTIELNSLAARSADVKVGQMYLAEWEEQDRIINDPLTRAAIRPGGFGLMPFENFTTYADRIDEELRYLRVTPGLVLGNGFH